MRSKSKIMTSTVTTIAVSFFLIISVIFAVLFDSLQKNAKSELMLMGQKYVNIFESKINTATDYLSLISSTFEFHVKSGDTDRKAARDEALHIFSDFGLIDGSSIYFEPDMYDGKDAEYIGTEYGTEKSGRICWYFYKENGKVAYIPEGLQEDIEFEMTHYTKAKYENSPVYTEPTVHEVNAQNIPMFTITYPIQNSDGRFIGAVTVDLFLEDIYEQLKSEKIYDTGYVIIAGDNSRVIYSPVYQDVGMSRKDAGVNYVLPSGEETVVYSNDLSRINNKSSLIATISVYTPLLDSNFYISAAAPKIEIYKNMIWVMTVLSVFSVSIILIILFLLRKKILIPIEKITLGANKIAGDSPEEIIELIEIDELDKINKINGIDENTETKNEIHILSIALKKMLSKINQIQEIKLESLEFKHEKEKAEAASKTKSAFLANMSHEIRTPMNAIVGMSELILREKDISPIVYEYTTGIRNAGANLLSIINDILDFSKIESERLEIIPAEYLFTSLINDVLNIIRMKIAEKSMLFLVNIDCNIPNRLIGDEVRIRQILLNLLGNAVKYTREGFVSVTATGTVSDNMVTLSIEIADSGIGIKEEDIGKLFENFIQVDTVKNKSIEGTGLGLTITKNLSRLMGGDISVESEYGVGSKFTLTLPQTFEVYEKLASVENPEEKQVLIYEPRTAYAESIVRTVENLGVNCTSVNSQSKLYEELKSHEYPFVFVSPLSFENTKRIIENNNLFPSKVVLLTDFGEASSPPNEKTIAMPAYVVSVANVLNDVSENVVFIGKEETFVQFIAPDARILIVDDISINLKIAEGLMSPYKMSIDVCNSGAESIELVQANKYDIIFMDHMMPEMDGIEATNIIRELEDEDGYYRDIPIIALTANAISGVKEMFLQNGLNDFLAKPIEISKLNAMLEKWIPDEKRLKYESDAAESASETSDPVIEPEYEIEIEGIDVQAGIATTGGNTDRYIKILDVFYKDGQQKINEIRECANTNNIKLYTTLVHAIKGVTATIGASEISALAYKLESAGKNGDVDFIQENTEKFLQQFKILLENINSAISEEADTDIQAESMSDDARLLLENGLKRLKSALDDMDIGEINTVLGEIENAEWDKKTSDIIYDISQDIILFEYDSAIAKIDELLGEK